MMSARATILFLWFFGVICPASCQGYKPLRNWPVFALSFASGSFNGVGDTMQFHYGRSVFRNFENQQYWNPDLSWRNKYWHGQPENGAKFPGSTGPLVFLTDAWHLSKTLSLTSIQIAVPLYEKPRKFKYIVFDLLITKAAFGAGWIFANEILSK